MYLQQGDCAVPWSQVVAQNSNVLQELARLEPLEPPCYIENFSLCFHWFPEHWKTSTHAWIWSFEITSSERHSISIRSTLSSRMWSWLSFELESKSLTKICRVELDSERNIHLNTLGHASSSLVRRWDSRKYMPSFLTYKVSSKMTPRPECQEAGGFAWLEAAFTVFLCFDLELLPCLPDAQSTESLLQESVNQILNRCVRI